MEKKQKKAWSTPTVELLSKGYDVEGGVAINLGEGSITRSAPFAGHPGEFKQYFNGGITTSIVSHTRHHYAS